MIIIINFGDIMKDIADKEAQYKKLKSNEVTSIPDKELKEAVIYWMRGMFKKDWSDDFEVIHKLSKPCQYVYSCSIVVDEVLNGGLTQLYINSSARFIESAIHGFLEIGSEELFKILAESLNIYSQNIEKINKYDDGTVESFCSLYEEELFNHLDSKFSQVEAEFEPKVNAYIRDNESSFGY